MSAAHQKDAHIVIAHDEALASRPQRAANLAGGTNMRVHKLIAYKKKEQVASGKWPYRELNRLIGANAFEKDVVYYERAIQESRDAKAERTNCAHFQEGPGARLLPQELARGRKRAREGASSAGADTNRFADIIRDTRWMNKNDPRQKHESDYSEEEESSGPEDDAFANDADQKEGEPKPRKRSKKGEDAAEEDGDIEDGDGDYGMNHQDDDEDGNENGAYGEGGEDESVL
jgi:hypothetical protein